MDAFEVVVSKLFEAEGYWVRPSYKVNLGKETKAGLGNHSMPRPEIDLLAYRPGGNEVLALECKSYFDSTGVVASSVLDPGEKYNERFKMFTREALRTTVLAHLGSQLVSENLCLPNPVVQLGLAVGHFRSAEDRERLELEFPKRGWRLFTDVWLKTRINALAGSEYDDSVVTISAKLLSR